MLLRIVTATAAVLVLAGTGLAWSQYHDAVAGLRRSGTLSGLTEQPTGAAQNILIMGLDSRLDENGDPLPADLYQAMDTGGADVGGYNANVLMLLHLPGDGSRASAFSIPRDDYVDLVGSPDGTAQGKIKQAYGLAFDQRHRELAAQGVTDKVTLEQQSRDAGRNAEIATVGQFLDVPIDHFVEVTLVAFYQIAQVVQPITVCVNEDTRDSYSGANFHQGLQQIDAAQAVAFVRQRRDNAHPWLNFTDLDRERRQQAFIASLAYQLRQAGTLTDPAKLSGLIAVAQQNTAIDPGLDLLALASQAADSAGNLTFTTLPIERFGTDPKGEDVNIVDPDAVRAAVQQIITPGAAPAPVTTAPVPSVTVDVLNGSGRTDLAGTLSTALAGAGWTTDGTGNTAVRSTSVIEYAPGDDQAAATLGHAAGITALRVDNALPAGHLRVLLGRDYTAPGAAPSPTAAAPTTPAPLSGGGIPCVK